MKKYFYSDGNEKHGPLSLDELKQENIAKDTLIWFEELDDWTPASDLEEMIPILELRPPPILATDNKFDSEKDSKVEVNCENNQNDVTIGLKEASKVWMILGFIFAVLGGYLGIVFGLNYAFGNYTKGTKRLGWIIVILGFISSAILKSL